MVKHYGFTLKINNKKNLVNEDYMSYIRMLEKKGEIVNYVFEDLTKDGKPAKLHVHGMVTFMKVPNFRLMCPYGMHTSFEELDSQNDIDNWMRYIQKNARTINKNEIYLF